MNNTAAICQYGAVALHYKLRIMDLDNIKALCEGGDLYASNGDYTTAICCWSLAAEDNADHEGKYRLGICYYEGKGVKQDMFSAISWLNNASRSGSFKAAKMLGGYYENLAYSIVEREVSVTDNQLAIWHIPRIEKTKILTYPEYLNNAIEYYSQYLINIDAYVHWDNRQEIGFDLEKKARKIIDSDIADELKIEKLKRLMRAYEGCEDA